MRPDISILIPARNERSRIAPTIRAIARARKTRARLEFVVVDDASTDDSMDSFVATVPMLLEEPNIAINLCKLTEHAGIYAARNQAAHLATADIVFTTDAHVRFSAGWDRLVFEHLQPDRILAGTIAEEGTPFRGYGCTLVVPFMGTRWVTERVQGSSFVQIAACPATVMTRALYERLGGYDEGMPRYGGGEPEFSVRAWLSGAEIVGVADLVVVHRFKPKDELTDFIAGVRPFWVHNCIRFGLLYLNELGCMQLLRYYANRFPHVFQEAFAMVSASDVWERRAYLERYRARSFAWFVRYFGLRDQAGGEII